MLRLGTAAVCLAAILASPLALAQANAPYAQDTQINVANGLITFVAPKGWTFYRTDEQVPGRYWTSAIYKELSPDALLECMMIGGFVDKPMSDEQEALRAKADWTPKEWQDRLGPGIQDLKMEQMQSDRWLRAPHHRAVGTSRYTHLTGNAPVYAKVQYRIAFPQDAVVALDCGARGRTPEIAAQAYKDNLPDITRTVDSLSYTRR